MIWVAGLCALGLSLPTHNFKSLVETSTVVVYGNFPNTKDNALEVFAVLAGALRNSQASSIEIEIHDGEAFTDSKWGK